MPVHVQDLAVLRLATTSVAVITAGLVSGDHHYNYPELTSSHTLESEFGTWLLYALGAIVVLAWVRRRFLSAALAGTISIGLASALALRISTHDHLGPGVHDDETWLRYPPLVLLGCVLGQVAVEAAMAVVARRRLEAADPVLAGARVVARHDA